MIGADGIMEKGSRKDFFISYTSADRTWAEWIAWQLEQENYTTIIQAWDIQAGSNFVLEMDTAAKTAERTIAVLSPDYFTSHFTPSEWAAAFRRDPKGEHRFLVPVRVRECDVEGLLGQIVYIDLVGQDEQQAARTQLLTGIRKERAKPSVPPAFPPLPPTILERPVFPGGDIHADTIKDVTNVVSGPQSIGTQNIYGANGPNNKRTPPLQRPRRAEHFVDREAERAILLADLHLGRVVTVCGLGGMGKTALVAEVLWTLAPAVTPPPAFPDGILFYSFYGQPAATIALEQLARTLGEEPVPTPALAAQRALSGKRILLVLDGAEEADHLGHVLAVCGGSAVLLTSRRRADAPDPAYRLDLQPLAEHEAVSVVQAFGGEQAADATATRRICERVGNLPLALRLVGRYLAEQEEEASEYLSWLEQTPLSALDRGTTRQESVPVLLQRSTTRLSAPAQQVLHLVGLLAVAAFDRLLIVPMLELSEDVARRALGELVNYGLLVRQQSCYEVSHPLIHTYAREELVAQDDPATQRARFERIVRVLDEQFPEVEYANWRRCEELLPHVQTCATLIAQYQVILPEAAYLLTKAGWYLREQAQYTQAAPLLQQALTIIERSLGSDHSYLGDILNCLAQLYRDQGRSEEAEPLFQRALVIREKALGLDHPNTGITLNNLANLNRAQGRYKEAELLYQRSLAIKEKVLPPDHPEIANTLGNLALLYYNQGHYKDAEPLYQRTLTIVEKALPPDHPNIANALAGLAHLYRDQRRYEEAEPLYQRALAIYEKALPPDHSYTSITLKNYAKLLRELNRPREAHTLEQRAQAIRTRSSSKSTT
jgi:tetratricopeptide (TPR) repeat protein